MLSPEQSQQITNLRQRMLLNVQAGRPPHDGIDREELRAGLALLRTNRAPAAAVKAAKPGRPAKAVKTTKPPADLSALAGLDLD